MRCAILALLLSIVALSAATSATATDSTTSAKPQPIAADDLQADADVLYDAIKSLHPGVYRYLSPAQFDARFDNLKHELAHGASLAQAYLTFTRFAVAIRCGHTWTNPLNQPPRVASALLELPDRLPLQFRVVGRRFLVTRAVADGGVRRGDEIVAIDGRDTARVIDALWPYLRADGSSDGKRLAQIGHDGGESAFDLYYPLVEPARQTRTLTLRAFGSGPRRTVRVALMTEAARAAALSANGGAELNTWSYSAHGDVAVIDMPTWAFWNEPFDWKDWLEKTFADLDRHKTPYLVIDLRRNEGGDGAIGQWLLEHLATSAHDYAGHQPVLIYDVVPERLRAYLSTWSKQFYDQRPRIEALADGTFTLKDREPEHARIVPAATPFAGKAFVLIGPNDSSATFEFARVVQETHLATLVGQATGGNLRGINGGNMFFLTLPHTGITIDVPVIAWKARSGTADAPVLPDITVVADLVALAHGEDPEMKCVEALIRMRAKMSPNR